MSRRRTGDGEKRSWQLVMTGNLPDPLSPELITDLTRLLDLRPDLACLDLETDAGGVHVARDWSSDKVDEVAALERRIAAAPGVRGLTLHPRKAPPLPCRAA
ncbi:hypothetical protein [Novosphingobium sp. EMRT-2]|uniref:hypothetical protein n=1 Tax=Novosphingobium sp. EMRT-2 TaxID=2571749 RepID=UPI0010BDD6D3|nr:hypothetical protein [Novosphingobium sp. EMRT-2]QCI96230.1 hypothetical protein FA702_21365 [Novosphingobium sp. EMRT-2]QCI96257.1 hypothetical protein FA702_21535 [Novosphingobium sp. EMRT-2]